MKCLAVFSRSGFGVVVALAFRYAARQIPPDELFDAWPADPNLLRRLLGSRKTPTDAR